MTTTQTTDRIEALLETLELCRHGAATAADADRAWRWINAEHAVAGRLLALGYRG